MADRSDGKDFETLTAEVFRRLSEPGGLVTDLSHDVTLPGKTASHQVDVTFTFKVAGVEYRTIIQCKDWVSRVKQEQLFSFKTVLDDIPGQPRGVFVSKSGFQRGAIDFAKAHGIRLYELRPPRDEDWEGLMRSVHVQMNLRVPTYVVSFGLDLEWIRGELRAMGVQEGHQFTINVPGGPEMNLRQSDGSSFDLRGFLSSRSPRGDCARTQLEANFDEAVFLQEPNTGLPISRVKLAKVSWAFEAHTIQSEMQIRLDHLVAYCFKDVLTSESRFLKQDGAE